MAEKTVHGAESSVTLAHERVERGEHNVRNGRDVDYKHAPDKTGRKVVCRTQSAAENPDRKDQDPVCREPADRFARARKRERPERRKECPYGNDARWNEASQSHHECEREHKHQAELRESEDVVAPYDRKHDDAQERENCVSQRDRPAERLDRKSTRLNSSHVAI